MTTGKKHKKKFMVRERWLYVHHIYVNKLNLYVSHGTPTIASNADGKYSVSTKSIEMKWSLPVQSSTLLQLNAIQPPENMAD